MIPTTIQGENNGSPVNLMIDYPAGKILDVGLEEPIAVYTGKVDIAAHIAPDHDTDALEIKARIQACDDNGRCLLPAELASPVIELR